ncbi:MULTISPECIES: ABC transporter ATP-binding protein [unclassified Shinella]|uniref:ABC transporter ATP-binding protein n=1 Tax=unclassified Shinella TaxID=2643062 RepID=UPI00234E9B01|nr:MULTISPECIES: ABC transporter ATP-binding protein [unclassified Shinella]MCO5151296.1 ABC transporter ATP-binding protein [Shinella sp.]MDC7266177.1 ABC transporter ATP-binding protein [Shinella sp. HY16]MDC7273074.1 ABC transporter ATP-binding protein [Shinella sp. YZ44]
MAQIRIQNVRKEFGAFTAVRSSSFTIEDGEFFMLLGPSGCGKTTTLRMMAGLELPTSGEIFIDGEEVGMKPASQRDIAFVFQMFALYPHMNVRKNISYPLVSQGMKREEVKARVAEVARILKIEHILEKPVGGLSGGDRQRVALGRAIVRRPKAFFMDEPLGALDAEFREHMAEELRALHDRMGATTVYVTHDQLEAMQMGDKIVVMNHGVVEQFGRPQQIYDWPATKFVAQFIGSPSMNFLEFEGMIGIGGDSVDLGGIRMTVPAAREGRAGRLTLGVRPEHVRLRDDAAYRGRVSAVEYLGTTQIVTLSTGHGELKARISSGHRVREDELVGLDFDARTLSLFDAESGKALLSEGNEGVLAHG